MTYGRLAQLVEHLLDVQEVTGSSPVPSTIQFVLEPDSLRKRVRVRFLFTGDSEKGLLGTVNEQRQGIIVAMVSCLLLCRIKFALCELGRSPIWLTGGQSLRTCVPGACTPLARCNTLDFVPKSVCQGAVSRLSARSSALKCKHFEVVTGDPHPFSIPAERVRTYAGGNRLNLSYTD